MQTAADPDELETGSDSAGYTSDSDTSCSDGEGVRERGCCSPAADELCDSSDDNGFSDVFVTPDVLLGRKSKHLVEPSAKLGALQVVDDDIMYLSYAP